MALDCVMPVIVMIEVCRFKEPNDQAQIPVLVSPLTLHILNFSSTLTPATTIARHGKRTAFVLFNRIDLTTPSFAVVLNNFS